MRRLIAAVPWIGVGFVLAIAGLVLVKAHSEPDYWPVAWPGVLTGCGTLGLAGVTYLVLRGDQIDRRKRDVQDKQRIEQERRAQAAKVQISEAIEEGGSGVRGEWHERSYRVNLINRSDDAVGEGKILFVINPPEARLDNIGLPVFRVGRVTAGEGAERRMAVKLRAAVDNPVPHEVLVWFTFRDAAGVMWARDPDHRLIEISDEDAERLAMQAERGMTNGLKPAPEGVDPSPYQDEGPWVDE